MATRVWESAIIGAPIAAVWGAVRPLNFAYLKDRVVSAEVEEKKTASEVGATVRVTYKDGTVQRLKIVELSDANHSISWDLVESTPAISVMGVVHTLKLRRVTDTNSTFIEWTTDFSSDAGQDVTQDARFKQKENFEALSALFASVKEEKTAGKPLIGGLAGVYNPQVARDGVLELWGKVQAMQKQVNEAANAPLAHAALVDLTTRYKALPISWAPNWAAGGLDAATVQAAADDVRTKLNDARSRAGDNGLPLPRLFNAQ